MIVRIQIEKELGDFTEDGFITAQQVFSVSLSHISHTLSLSFTGSTCISLSFTQARWLRARVRALLPILRRDAIPLTDAFDFR